MLIIFEINWLFQFKLIVVIKYGWFMCYNPIFDTFYIFWGKYIMYVKAPTHVPTNTRKNLI